MKLNKLQKHLLRHFKVLKQYIMKQYYNNNTILYKLYVASMISELTRLSTDAWTVLNKLTKKQLILLK